MRASMTSRRSERGITVLEILLMFVVLAVLAGITYPKFLVMLYQSRESRTKLHLGELRGAIAIYYSDNFGLYPSDEGMPKGRLSSSLVPRYLKLMPQVELTHYHPGLNTVQDHLTDAGDWLYTAYNGFVGVNCWHVDSTGRVISLW